jgi:hypothetical protein
VKPAEELRRYLRVRLSDGRLFAARGIYTVRQGTGRPCNVCERAIAATTMEHQVIGPDVFGLAHKECYTIGREESAHL